MEVTSIASWYGSNRTLAPEVGKELAGCSWVGIPFAGGMSEVAHITARTINVNDLHRHVINLGRVIANPVLGPQFYRKVRRIPFHPDALAICQDQFRPFNGPAGDDLSNEEMIRWAVAYFVCAWMTRHATAGTNAEFTGGLSTRWIASGGDSAAHYQGAVRSINAWRQILRRCNFTTLDFRDFLAECRKNDRDRAGHGIYSDAPFDRAGEKYAHKFSEADHIDLRDDLAAFKYARVVVRFYRTRFIEKLYGDPWWHWRDLSGGKKQTNAPGPEVLIINGPSYAEPTP